jgi:hypothetical protein
MRLTTRAIISGKIQFEIWLSRQWFRDVWQERFQQELIIAKGTPKQSVCFSVAVLFSEADTDSVR